MTNQWPYDEIVGVRPTDRCEFTLVIQKKKKRDTMRFTSDFRSELLHEILAAKSASELGPRCREPPSGSSRYDSQKHHWSGTKLPVTLEVNQSGVSQLDPTTKQHLATYPFHTLEGVSSIEDSVQGVVLTSSRFGRLHTFDVADRASFLAKVHENAGHLMASPMKTLKAPSSAGQASADRLGSFGSDEHLTSLVEFAVHKLSARHPDAVRRLLCMSETCLIDRDPDSYR